MPVPPARFAVRRIGPADAGEMGAWMRGRGVAEGWVPANTYAVGFYRKCGFATDEGEILVKELH
ncbi:hypothetical protein LFT45_03885 [Arthrobacter sp. FW305-BF8]|uniref:hypothetical protein n=1 Tax=Arthrobacter sp. FW305-BF8 TaxID=2879617 RepID=UPI001F4538C2|nr:hypothetical protein [Arthrobacter sp. FW305-BF8]UKA55094.1 hypothetical protein LFT45_03885 [Arthrobacter sp. FW305-BF8]